MTTAVHAQAPHDRSGIEIIMRIKQHLHLKKKKNNFN